MYIGSPLLAAAYVSHALKLFGGMAPRARPAEPGAKGQRSSTRWLIRRLRQRILASGLECKVLKLMPTADRAHEFAGEIEIESGHSKTLICIGARKAVKPFGIGEIAPHNLIT